MLIQLCHTRRVITHWIYLSTEQILCMKRRAESLNWRVNLIVLVFKVDCMAFTTLG